MLLYGPKPCANVTGARGLRGSGNTLPTYEIVVHSSKYRSQSLSIFRTSDKGNQRTKELLFKYSYYINR